jgi:type I pantothenate kinase
MKLRSGAFANPDSYFHQYSTLSDEEAIRTATGIWDRINGPNLVQNVLPTRGRAKLVLTKNEDHHVKRVLMRKI